MPYVMPDGRPLPRLSIVTPSYNKAQFIEETIRSVLLQGYPDFEYIIVDGGSTDGTVEIIRKYEPWLARWVSEPDRGQSNAVNKGILMATGEILYWLNADDMCMPRAFERVAHVFVREPSVRLLTGQAMVVDKNGRPLRPMAASFTSWEDYALRRCSIYQVSTFFRKGVFKELGGLDESLHFSMDRELFLRVTRLYPPLVIQDCLALFRDHSESKTRSRLVAGLRESARMSLRYLRGTPWHRDFLRVCAERWLSVVNAEGLGHLERLICILEAIRKRPRLLVSRMFWKRFSECILALFHETSH
ncbi:MAG: glycosyltransferase [candidate division KSB1 bacterium]|nr:glycosyltransferase [candidate division KSB1 bacterium]